MKKENTSIIAMITLASLFASMVFNYLWETSGHRNLIFAILALFLILVMIGAIGKGIADHDSQGR